MTRLISAKRTEIMKMSAGQLKQSIWDSEGRVVLSQCMAPWSLVRSVMNPELAQAMGADMVFFNGYSCEPGARIDGLSEFRRGENGFEVRQYSLKELREYIDVPMGVYLECGLGFDISNNDVDLRSRYRVASEENINYLIEQGVNFIVLGGNPGTGTKYDTIIAATKKAKEIAGDRCLVFAGKWEDGAKEPVLGDPIRPLSFYKDIIAQLIDAGADCINLPMPGSRWAITVDDIRELVTFIHTYKSGTLALSFLDGTVEGSDEQTVRDCVLMSKQTGADIHALGDAGLGGMTVPEDIYAACITIKGRSKTWDRMAGSRH